MLHLCDPRTSHLEADFLAGALAAVVVAGWVRHDGQAFLLLDGSFPDVL